jgi:hypothetical protein
VAFIAGAAAVIGATTTHFPIRMRCALRTALILGVVAACGEGPAGPRRFGELPAAVRIDAPRTLLVEGDSVRLGYSLLDKSGSELTDPPPGAAPMWRTLTDAVLLVESDGRVTGLAPGWGIVTLEVDGLADTVTIRVDSRVITLRVSAAYLVQAVQRLSGDIPLVAGRDAMLRVFAEGDQLDNAFGPELHVHIYHDDIPVSSAVVQAPTRRVPTEADETSMAGSWNLRVPAALVRPGLGFRVVLDPDKAVPRTDASQTQLPRDGGVGHVVVHELPPHRVRFVPIRLESGFTGNVHSGNTATYLELFRRIYPVHAVESDVTEPYTTSVEPAGPAGWVAILNEVYLLQQLTNDSTLHYYGVVPSSGGGYAMMGRPVAIGSHNMTAHPHAGTVAAATFAHETGHNFGRGHAPCGGAGGVDPGFPYLDGSIGVVGYDLMRNEIRGPGLRDVMSYCMEWISDYTYEHALAFRLARAGRPVSQTAGGAGPVLLVWGRVTPSGDLVLEPAFELMARPVLPEGAGPYSIEGFDDNGVPLFSISFAGEEVSHTSARVFAFAIPADNGAFERLGRLRFTGPEGSAEQVRSADPLATLVRDAETGMMLAVTRGGRVPRPPDGRTVEVLSSHGTGSVRMRDP